MSQSSPMENRDEIGMINTKIFYKKTIGIFKAIMISIIFIFSNAITIVRAKIKPCKLNEFDDTKIKIKEGIRFLLR